MFSTNETCEDLKECYLVSNIPKRNLASGCHLLKKLINLHGGQLDVTTNIYLKSCAYHPNSECCTFFHRNLSDPKSSEGTLLYLSLETCWSRLIYTKLSSYRSFVINMYVITMAWRCIGRSLLRRREIDIFHICQQISAFWSKNNLIHFYLSEITAEKELQCFLNYLKQFDQR